MKPRSFWQSIFQSEDWPAGPRSRMTPIRTRQLTSQALGEVSFVSSRSSLGQLWAVSGCAGHPAVISIADQFATGHAGRRTGNFSTP